MQVLQMMSRHPQVQGLADGPLIRCIEECYSSAQACTSCADACLGEDTVKDLTQCIRLNLDCADICVAAGSIASRRTGSDQDVVRRMLWLCGTACATCAEQCEQHAQMYEHCRLCADACRHCQQACKDAQQSIH
jgi:hypothetical protein